MITTYPQPSRSWYVFPDLKVVHTGDLITEGMPVMDYANGASAVEWVSVLDKAAGPRLR